MVLYVGRFGFLSSFPPLSLPFSFFASWIPQKGLKQERDVVETSTAAVLPSKYTPVKLGEALALFPIAAVTETTTYLQKTNSSLQS